MNRRNFFKVFGTMIGAAVVCPTLLAKAARARAASFIPTHAQVLIMDEWAKKFPNPAQRCIIQRERGGITNAQVQDLTASALENLRNDGTFPL